MPAQSIELLIEFTKDEDPRTRATAIAGLSKVADPRGFAPVVVALFDPVDEVRVVAATALGVFGDERAVEPLAECLDDPSEQVAATCAWALGKVPARGALDRLVAVLEDAARPEALRIAAVTAIGERLELPGSELALEAVAHRDALAARGAAGNAAAPANGTAAANATASDSAPDSLPATPACDAVRGTLLRTLDSTQGELAASTMWALGRLPRTNAAATAAIAALAADFEWTVRYAIEALVNFGDASAISALEPLRDHSSADVARLAASAIDQLRDSSLTSNAEC